RQVAARRGLRGSTGAVPEGGKNRLMCRAVRPPRNSFVSYCRFGKANQPAPNGTGTRVCFLIRAPKPSTPPPMMKSGGVPPRRTVQLLTAGSVGPLERVLKIVAAEVTRL